MWKVVCQSVAGILHLEKGLPCQDYAAYRRLSKDLLIGAVSDGAGSAEFSDIGARVAVESALTFLANLLDVQDADTGDWLSHLNSNRANEYLCSLCQSLVEQVVEQLQAQAESHHKNINDFAATLITFIATPDMTVALQIGDGFILLRGEGGEYQLLFQPEKGEYINETTFITATNVLEHIQVGIVNIPTQFICVGTDGVENVSINLSNWQPFTPFFQPLEQYLQETEKPLAEDLQEFLQRKELSARTTDDKTLLLAMYTENL